jgi:hypothetical protein
VCFAVHAPVTSIANKESGPKDQERSGMLQRWQIVIRNRLGGAFPLLETKEHLPGFYPRSLLEIN